MLQHLGTEPAKELCNIVARNREKTQVRWAHGVLFVSQLPTVATLISLKQNCNVDNAGTTVPVRQIAAVPNPALQRKIYSYSQFKSKLT